VITWYCPASVPAPRDTYLPVGGDLLFPGEAIGRGNAGTEATAEASPGRAKGRSVAEGRVQGIVVLGLVGFGFGFGEDASLLGLLLGVGCIGITFIVHDGLLYVCPV